MSAAKSKLGLAIGCAILAAAALCRADTVIKKSGQTLTGLIIAESDNDITIQNNVGELVVRTKVARNDIAEIHKDAVAEHRYCRIPIHGEIGKDVKVDWLAKAFAQAIGFDANYVVLDIDSPGGDIQEMAKIMELISKQDKVKVVAHVHKAMSAAAMIAMTCPTIIVDGRASIGAAVPWKVGPDGTPMEVEAKFISAYRALCKSAAEYAHHSPLLAQGMIDMNLALMISKREGGVEIIEGEIAPASDPRAKVLKKKGEIMCLSSAEAIESGLAVGTAEWPKDLQKILGVNDWAPVGESVWAYMEARPVAEKVNHERAQEAQAALAAKSRVVQQINAIDARITALMANKAEAEKQAEALPGAYKAEIAKIHSRLGPSQHDDQVAQIKAKYQALFDKTNDAVAQAEHDVPELSAQKNKLLADLKAQEDGG